MKAKDHPDWPKEWACDGTTISSDEVSQLGTLIMVKPVSVSGIGFVAAWNDRRTRGERTATANFLPRDMLNGLRAIRAKFAVYNDGPVRDAENMEL